MADPIHVNSPDGRYPIVIEAGLLGSLDLIAQQYGLDQRIVVISNPTVMNLYGSIVQRYLPNAAAAVMPDGEAYKNLETVGKLYEQMVSAKADRNTAVLAVGGGVVGDTAGFVAATYMRGVPFVQMPTTLLSMVDSSVGGKVGVDLPQGKNLVGAFKQPQAVLIDPSVLKTLPQREWRCGLAEVIKHGLLADAQLLEMAVTTDQENAAALVRRAVQIKVDVVEADPYEQGVRATLNLGHTFGHALEQASHYAWPHGEAVAVGLVAAAYLSQTIGLCKHELPEQVENILEKVGLPIRIKGIEPEAIYAAMSTDKKWSAGKARFILLRGVGLPQIVEGISRQDVMVALRQVCK